MRKRPQGTAINTHQNDQGQWCIGPNRYNFRRMARSLPAAPPVRKSTRLVRRWLLLIVALPLLGLLGLPLVALLLRTAGATLVHTLGQTAVVEAIGLSLGTTTITLLLSVLFGMPLACLLAGRRFKGQALLEVLIDLPTVLPPAVAGVALLLTLGRNGIIGSWLRHIGVEIPFTPAAVVIAQMFVASPYYIKGAAVGLAGVNEELHEAAALDGATPGQAFRFVTAPLAWRGFVSGAALCWARALGEFGATIIFAGNIPGRTQTAPLAVYIGFQIDFNQALTLAAILLVISFGLLLMIRATLPELDPRRKRGG